MPPCAHCAKVADEMRSMLRKSGVQDEVLINRTVAVSGCREHLGSPRI